MKIKQKRLNSLTEEEMSLYCTNLHEVQEAFSDNWDALISINPVCIITQNGMNSFTIDLQDIQRCSVCGCAFKVGTLHEYKKDLYCEECRVKYELIV